MIPDIVDIDDEDDEDDGVRDMEIDDIPGLEDMQMPSDDESEDEAHHRKLCYCHCCPTNGPIGI